MSVALVFAIGIISLIIAIITMYKTRQQHKLIRELHYEILHNKKCHRYESGSDLSDVD